MKNPFSVIGDKFIRKVRKTKFDRFGDYQPLLDLLDLVKINEGYVLDFYKTRIYEYDILPYIRKKEDNRLDIELLGFMTHTEEKLFQQLSIPFTEMGIWQGYLIHILPSITPKNGHALYRSTLEIYSDMDLKYAMNHIQFPPLPSKHEELLNSLSYYLGNDVILPKVTIKTGERAVVESTFWSEYGGLVHETTEAIKNGETIKYESKDQKILVKYDCGVNF